MKKIILIIAILALTSIGVFAATGDVVGNIYSTDILAYVNGRQINSYNIGGRTVVLAEELCNNNTGEHYGFSCVYDDSTRTLNVTSTFSQGNVNPEIARGTVGEITGNIYETDIKVYFNGEEITGYNIGGLTAICIEDLGAYTIDQPNGQYGYSKYLCNSVWNPENREISLNSFIQDSNYFGNYPSRKLEFVLNDNMLSCSFDQLGPYNGSFKYNFSDTFKNDVYKIKPVLFGGDTVGQMIVLPGGMAVYSMDDMKLHQKTGGLERILSYDHAKSYVADNFTIVSEAEDENASIYLAKKDDVHYLLFAMKNGGLVCDSKYDSSYKSVALVSENGVPCLNLESNLFSGSMPIATAGYDFEDSIEDYVGVSITYEDRLKSRAGNFSFEYADDYYSVSALSAYAYDSAILVNLDEMVQILGIDYYTYGGVFYISAGERKILGDSVFDSEYSVVPQSVRTLQSSKVYLDGKKTKFTYLSVSDDGSSYLYKEAVPYYYNGGVYVPYSFFTEMYQ